MFTVTIGAQCVGRFTGDLLINRLGRAGAARLGGVLIAVGGIVVVSATNPVVLIVGLVMAGFGCATTVPSAFVAAASLPGVSQGAGLTLVSWLLRVGFLATSPIIGTIATVANLRVSLALLILVGVAVFTLAPALGDGHATDSEAPPARA
jgi:MFS family permease